jgi:hypothetical protein
LQADTFRKILSPTLTNAKSSNATVRAYSVDLFKVLMSNNPTDTAPELAVTELLSLPKAGKTTGPDRRIALYSMLACLAPSPAVSTSILPSLMAKDTHDTATAVLASVLPPHIVFLLWADTPPPVEAVDINEHILHD